MKLVLMDRDGVINEELPGYVKSPEELVILAQALSALALLRQHNFTCVVITNQSVVGRGIISRRELDRVHDHLRDTVKTHGGNIEDIIVCTDHPDHATYRRKPKPGMLIEALEKYGATAAETPYIGDALIDLEAAHAAGCPRYLVMTGKGEHTQRSILSHLQPITVCTDILDAAQKIVTSA